MDHRIRIRNNKNKLIDIVLVIMLISFIMSTIISITSISSVVESENRGTATLLADNIYDEIYMELQKHVAMGRTIAVSNELKEILEHEADYTDEEMEAILKKVLGRYTDNLDVNTAFLVSMDTNRYYTQEGFNKIVDPEGDEHDIWFKNFLDTGLDYCFDIDVDEVHGHIWTVFINNRLYGDDGRLLGICGMGTEMADMQSIIKKIQDSYGVIVKIVDQDGVVQVDMDDMNIDTSYGNVLNFGMEYGDENTHYVGDHNGYTVTKYMKDLGWAMVIQRDIDFGEIVFALVAKNLVVMTAVFLLFLFITTYIIDRESKVVARDVMMESYGKLSDIYDAMYIISLKHDRVRRIKSSLNDYSEMISEKENLSTQIDAIIKNWVREDYVDRVLWFFNFTNVASRFEHKNSSSIDFMTTTRGWYRARLVAVRDEKNDSIDHVIILFEDIAEERQKEETLRLETEAAKAASEAKGRFLANMSHEIRTPINAVLGMDTMILRETSEPQIKEYAMNIHNAGNTLLSLVNDVLDISKIESGKMEILPEQYDLSTLIYDVMNMIGIKAEAKKLEVKLDIDENLPSGLYGDDVRIRQVIINLMNNAVKYTESGSVTLSVQGSVYKEADKDKVKLHIKVKDTGIGIKQEELHKLFEDFVRIEESRNRNIEGTGLGISITIQLLELMNSKLEVSSVYGQGSEFYFDLEQEIVSEEPLGDIKMRLSRTAENFTYESMVLAPDAKILLVDDTPVNRDVFKGLIKQTEIQIDEAGGGVEALELATKNHYDIIFLDHMMPDMDGSMVLWELKRRTDHPNTKTPIIVLTANAIQGAKEGYLAAGFNDYLSKPIIPENLERMLETYLPEDKKKEVKKVPKNINTEEPRTELPMIEGIDWNYARLHLKDDSSLFNTLTSFEKTIKLEADNLQELYDQILDTGLKEAVDQYRVKVHAMKSTATLLGFVPIAGMAATLEYAARDQKLDVVKEVTPHFLKAWRGYKDKLSFMVNDTAKEKIEDKALIVDYINKLKEAINLFDVHTADSMMEKLEGYSYPDELEEAKEKLPAAVANLDVDLVVSICDDMLVYFES